MQKVELIDRLAKSRAGRALLDEVEQSELAESAWIEAAADLKELKAQIPARRAELETALKKAQSEVSSAKDALRIAEERAGAAFRAYHSEIFQTERRTMQLQDVLFRNAPQTMLNELAALREKLLDNLDNPPGAVTVGTDLRRRKVLQDRSGIDAHMAEREAIKAAIADVEGRILSGKE